MKLQVSISVLVSAIVVLIAVCQAAPPRDASKVFNYQGFMPIKDDRTGELVKDEQEKPAGNETTPLSDQEAACWNLINEQSLVTFALQRKVLDEFDAELKELTLDEKLREFIEKTSSSMRENMDEAEKALKEDSAEGFFDSLFATSEQIIKLSSIIREPNLDDKTFLAFIKAVSRLGRNNAELIQDFAEMCAFAQKSPRPRQQQFYLPQ